MWLNPFHKRIKLNLKSSEMFFYCKSYWYSGSKPFLVVKFVDTEAVSYQMNNKQIY